MADPSPSIDDGRRAAATQIFVDPAVLDVQGIVDIDRDTEHHLERVLRLRDGEVVSVSDGAGRWRLAVVLAGASGSLRLETRDEVRTVERHRPPFTLATAIPKGDRLEWLVQKAVELGADTIQLLHAERSAVRWKPDRAAKNIDRLGRIALEASRQSRRVWLPAVLAPIDASEVISAMPVAEPGGRSVASTDNSLAIGPEGGWSGAELEMASELVRLGSSVLRIETAALVAVTLCVANF